MDVQFDRNFLVFRKTRRAYIDVRQPAEDLMEMINKVDEGELKFLHPHAFVLGNTLERVRSAAE